METSGHFGTRFAELKSGDYSGLAQFSHFCNNQVHLFINGKIYNEAEESILPGYLKEGYQGLKKLDGEFLLMIADGQKLLFFRDRHGAGKQFFYTNEYCTSYLTWFTTLPGFNCKPNYEALFTFLSIGYIPSPQSSLEGVNKLAGGCVLEITNSSFLVVDLFDYQDFISAAGTTRLSVEEATDEYERLHKKAIAGRIGQSEKVGLLLSGGYDSGGNISALRNLYNGDVVSYSIGFKDNPWTELPLAKMLAGKYNSRHFEYKIDGSEIMDLPQIIGAMGDPFQEGGLMVNYLAMRLVKNSGEEPGVILGGDGNDQHFGTSGKELALHWKFKKNGVLFFQKMFDRAGNNGLFEKDNLLFRVQFHNRKILNILQNDTFGFTRHQLNTLNQIGYRVLDYQYQKNFPKTFTGFDHLFLCRNYLIDIKQIINEVILFKASKMADFFGYKISFPYMSTDLYEFLKQMPVDYKFRGKLDELAKGQGESKYLHKSYLKSKLPLEITDRKKQGGFAPLPIFLKDGEQRRIIFGVIEKSDAVEALFDKQKIHRTLQQYEKIVGSRGYWFWFQQIQAGQIINLLTLVVWWNLFISGNKNVKSVFDLQKS